MEEDRTKGMGCSLVLEFSHRILIFFLENDFVLLEA
jgi:hypothetical protein